MFPHTYEPADVTVLLERLNPELLSKDERAAKIASGTHYNEVISREEIPPQSFLDLFKAQTERFGDKLAHLFLSLASTVLLDAQERDVQPVLVSLVRAGTPTGILLKRTLGFWGVQVPHYTVSIVQGRGFDEVAIETILNSGYKPEQLYFIDGWTGKGVVRNELSFALKKMSARFGQFHDALYVLSDIAGVAEYAATREDCLISSALLSGPISGLVSRSIYQGSPQEPRMHGAAYLDYMESCDLSRYFIDTIARRIKHAIDEGHASIHQVTSQESASLRMQAFYDLVAHRFNINDPQFLKPGIGESTRLFQRKKPVALIVRDTSDPEIGHLLQMAKEQAVPWVVWGDMTLKACAITP
jgi:hypothetical protein